MKKVRFITSVICLFFAFAVSSQEAYKGSLFVTKKELSFRDGRLFLDLHIDYERLSMASDEFIEITPVLVSPDKEIRFQTILLNGSEKQRTFSRRKFFGKKEDFSHIDKVIRNYNRDFRFRNINYTHSIVYDDWMKNAVLVLRTKECQCHGKKGRVYEDKINEGIYFPQKRTSLNDNGVNAQFLSFVNFLQPALKDNNHTRIIKGVIPFTKFGKIPIDVLDEADQNSEIYRILRAKINEELLVKGVQLAGVKVTGYGSPQGNYNTNQKDAPQRLYSLRTYLNGNRAANNAPLEVTWIAEDWDSIRTIVHNSDMQYKNAVIDIIAQVPENKGREKYLMELAGGAPYKYLKENVFPQVRRAEYEITVYQLDPALMANRRLFEAGGQQLDLSAFYMVANSYAEGSEEFNDIIDLTARLFPQSPEANINAAAVALSKNDTAKARHYLKRYETFAPAYNNMGVLYLLEGNKDKAEVYLRLAKEQGIPQAEKTLRYMNP